MQSRNCHFAICSLRVPKIKKNFSCRPTNTRESADLQYAVGLYFHISIVVIYFKGRLQYSRILVSARML